MNDSSQRIDGQRPLWVGGAVIVFLVLLWVLRGVAVLVGLSLLLAYALEPVVSALAGIGLPRGRHLGRPLSAAVVMLAVSALAVAVFAFTLPRLAAELTRFAQHAPEILAQIVQRLREYAAASGFGHYVDPLTEAIRANSPALVGDAAGAVAHWLGRLFGNLGQVLGLALLPLLSFYLLAEQEAVRLSAMRFVPEAGHDRLQGIVRAVDLALRSYVRGQAIVCGVMGMVMGSILALLGFPYALLLGVLAGLAEIVPYLGFATAALAILLTGFTLSPLHALGGLAAYAVTNNVIGMFVTPRVMGRHLRMHPYVVTVSILAGAELLGPVGVLLALPAAAVFQALVAELAPGAPTR